MSLFPSLPPGRERQNGGNVDSSLEKERARYLARLGELFDVSVSDARGIVEAFHGEMARGLAGEPSSLRMIPSFMGRPTGRERGRYLALDLGGTNCRVLEVVLDGRGGASVAAAGRFVIPRECLCGPGRKLFDFLAGCVDSFLREHPPEPRREPVLAFTFSFPVEQRSAVSGTLIGWTKAFTAPGVEGEDVAALLAAAMRRRGLESIRIAALTNDTVGTLLAGSYADPSCDMGVILGTGTNACYPERADRIRKLPWTGAAGEMIVNLEWGNFHRLTANRFDDLLDEASPNPGRQRLEKMVSGMYLGELARLAIREMMERGLLFPGGAGTAFSVPYGLTTEQLLPGGGAQADGTAPGLGDAGEDDRTAIREIGRLVTGRSARLAGSAITAVLTWMDPDMKAGHAVAIDGALFEHNPGYRAGISKTLDDLLGSRAAAVRLVLTRDGSGIGSAIAGAVASVGGGGLP